MNKDRKISQADFSVQLRKEKFAIWRGLLDLEVASTNYILRAKKLMSVVIDVNKSGTAIIGWFQSTYCSVPRTHLAMGLYLSSGMSILWRTESWNLGRSSLICRPRPTLILR